MILLFLKSICFGQNYNEKFKQICSEGSLIDSEEFLIEWKNAEPDNPEMLIGLFNYYLLKSESITGKPNFLGGYIFSASESDSISLKKITKKLRKSDSLFSISQKYLNLGIKKNINRLDMHLGKMHSLNEKGMKKKFVNSFKSLIRQNNINGGKWLWTENKISHKTEKEFIGIAQSYIYKMMNVNSPDFDKIIEISKLGLETYPKNHILLSNIGICKLQLGEINNAITFLKKGLKSKPDDIIIMFNLANAYTHIGEAKEAKKLYQFIIENGDEKNSKYAKELMDKL